MTTSLFAVALMFGACDAAAPHYEVYFSHCEGPRCDSKSMIKEESGVPNGWGAHKDTLQTGADGMFFPLYLAKTTYSSDHKQLKHEKLSPTEENGGMGYIDVDPKNGRALFASQAHQISASTTNVDTYLIDINTSAGAAGPNKPKLLIGDRSGLLAPCKNATYPGAIGGCVSVNTFFARFSGAVADEVIFAFVAWTELGDLAMAQGLAAVRTDGTGARILTHDTSVCPYGPCDGTMPPEKGFADRCPLALPSGKVVFTRSYNQGLSTRVAILDLKTGNVTVPEQLPHVGDKSGCPSVDASGERFIYMGCSLADKYGRCTDNATYSYGSVAVANPTVFVPNFEVPLINTTDYQDTYATCQCAYDRPSLKSISCLGANNRSLEPLKLAVGAKTGLAESVDNHSGVFCMTPECVQTHFVETPGQDVDGMTVVV